MSVDDPAEDAFRRTPDEPWPQPPPPPPVGPPPPPPPPPTSTWMPWVGSTPVTGGWSVGRSAAHVPLVPGRAPVAALAAASMIGAALLLPGLSSGLAILSTLPSTIAGTSGSGAGRAGVAALTALTVTAVLLTAVAARRWLMRVATHAGASSARALLAALPEAPGRIPGGIPAATRSARAALWLGLAGGALLGLGEAAWLGASSGTLARIGGVAAVAGAAAVVVAGALVPSVLRAVERREAEAGRTREGGWVSIPGPRSPALAVAASGVLLALVIAPFSLPGAARQACDLDAGWRCAAVRVPADHWGSDPRPDLVNIAYAVHPAAAPLPGQPRRVLIVATGGPGASGLADGAWMLDWLSSRIVDRFDVVTFDSRGVGLSDGRDCPDAAASYDAQDLTETAARDFARSCIREAGLDGTDLRRYATAQVAEDVDAIRAALGVDRFTLYGVSYGTVVAQAYAAAHPDRLEGLVLDAPIDRTIRPAELWARSATGFEAAVNATFAACGADPDCHDALPDPAAVRRRILDILDLHGGIEDRVVGQDGRQVSLTMTRSQFDQLTFGAMYDTSGRMSYLRALAAYGRGDDRPLLRLYRAWTGGPASSSFAYYATWCADVRVSPTTRTDDYAGYMDALRQAGITDPGDISVASSVAPCLFWPAQPEAWEPAVDPAGVPTLILTATADPVTPESEALAILGRLPDAKLVETNGGAHGSVGDPCPNERMADFVVDGRLPVARTSVCLGSVVDPFVPLAVSPPVTASDAAFGVAQELLADPDVLAWDARGRLAVGCAEGGTATFEAPAEGWRVTVTLNDCAWATGTAMDGSGWIDLSTWDADLTLRSQRGSLHLSTSGSAWQVEGDWDGHTVNERY